MRSTPTDIEPIDLVDDDDDDVQIESTDKLTHTHTRTRTIAGENTSSLAQIAGEFSC